jgi:hypothetical protein
MGAPGFTTCGFLFRSPERLDDAWLVATADSLDARLAEKVTRASWIRHPFLRQVPYTLRSIP